MKVKTKLTLGLAVLGAMAAPAAWATLAWQADLKVEFTMVKRDTGSNYIEYTIRVTNQGDDDARDVVLYFHPGFDSQTQGRSITVKPTSPPGWDCLHHTSPYQHEECKTSSGTTISRTGNVSFTIGVSVPASEANEAMAQVSGRSPDQAPSDNAVTNNCPANQTNC